MAHEFWQQFNTPTSLVMPFPKTVSAARLQDCFVSVYETLRRHPIREENEHFCNLVLVFDSEQEAKDASDKLSRCSNPLASWIRP